MANLSSKVQGLEELLRSIVRIDPQDNSYNNIKVSEERSAITHENKQYWISGKQIWYKQSNSITFASLSGIIKEELQKKGHPFLQSIIDCILLLFTYHPRKSETPIITLQEILNNVQIVSLSQYFLPPLRMSDEFKGLEFGNFHFGLFDSSKFEYRCKRATSDYYDLYKERLKNRFVIERDFFDVPIIVWQDISDKFSITDKEFVNDMLLYYEYLSSYYFEIFWDEFLEQQYLQVSLGIDYIDRNLFRQRPNSDLISIYSNIHAYGKKIGYVVPEVFSYLNISFPLNFDDQILFVKKKLFEQYSFKGYNGSEIHKTIETYVKFNAKGYVYLYENKTDEAFLHFVIALDLLLGSIGESTYSVSTRAAILTYKSCEKSFEEQMKKIQKIYDARSKYVHTGKNVDSKLLHELKLICRIILNTLFHLQNLEEYKTIDSFDKWINNLDIAIKTLGTEFELTEEKLIKMGIEKKSNVFLPLKEQ